MTTETCPDPSLQLPGIKVLLGVCGSVASYKAAEICRNLVKGGAEVSVVMTESATRFVSPMTFEALSGRKVWTGMFDGVGGEVMPHIDLAREADVVVIAPATADVIARAAAGRADDLLSCILLVTGAPVVMAPAMNPSMWAHPITRRNVTSLQELVDVQLVGPATGEAACGESGAGRMAAPDEIVAAALHTLGSDLAGVRVLITAGPTQEEIDPVRFVSNRSSGKMGYALARAAQQRGAEVTLLSGPVALEAPAGVETIPILSAADLQREVMARIPAADTLIMAAAVADYRVANPLTQKLKRSGESLTLKLEPNPDILAAAVSAREGSRPVIVGFALETNRLLEAARGKLERKGCDLLVANLAAEALGKDHSVAYILDETGILDEPGRLPKSALSNLILDRILERL